MHGDVTPTNAVCRPDDELRSRPIGVLDFGDVMRSWRIGDAAAAAVGALEHPGSGDSLSAALSVLAGYHSVLALTEAEIEAFWPLVVARTAVTAAISYRQWVGNARNGYAEDAVSGGVRAMHRVAAIDPALAKAHARALLGLTPVPHAEAALAALFARPRAALVADLAAAAPVDLSAAADAFAYGEWADRDALAELVGDRTAGRPLGRGTHRRPRPPDAGRSGHPAPRRRRLPATGHTRPRTGRR